MFSQHYYIFLLNSCYQKRKGVKCDLCQKATFTANHAQYVLALNANETELRLGGYGPTVKRTGCTEGVTIVARKACSRFRGIFVVLLLNKSTRQKNLHKTKSYEF